ncbi:SGNH/GDSL hydrolase family protein [bacterium]|nr:SGNH/GDSL hydrolase family protein [bacterium]
MRQHLFLVLFGLSVGVLSAAALYGAAFSLDLLPATVQPNQLVARLFGTSTTHFDTLRDFQKTMLISDEPESGESVPLRSLITPHPNPLVMYDLLPNRKARFQGVPVRLNSCGMRGGERTLEKDEHTVRIAFLGDSFTFGWGVQEPHSFVETTGAVLNRYLEASGHRDLRVETLNFGTPGYSTFQEVELFLEEDHEFQPDIVVVFFIANDFGLPFFIRDIENEGSMMTSTSFERAARQGSDGESTDQQIREERARIVANLDPNKALRKLVKASRREGFQPYLAFNPHPKWRENLKKLWFVRKSKRLKMISLRPRFLRAMKDFDIREGELSLPDDPHPSALKHAVLGGLLAESLLPRVAQIAELRGES